MTNTPEGFEYDWTIVVAVARNGVIGNQGELPWKLSSDLKRFKRMTMGHCLLMGRKTYDSIGRPLPGRQTIVLSRATGLQSSSDTTTAAGVTYVADVDAVSRHVEAGRQVMVVGGAQIYSATLPYCSTIWLTRVHADVEGDVMFPTIDWSQWRSNLPSTSKRAKWISGRHHLKSGSE